MSWITVEIEIVSACSKVENLTLVITVTNNRRGWTWSCDICTCVGVDDSVLKCVHFSVVFTNKIDIIQNAS